MNHPFRRWCSIALIASFAAVAMAACAGSNSPTVSKIFKAPPWEGAEHYSYNLVDQGDKVTGTCELTTTLDKEPGKTLLEHHCGNTDGDRDDRQVLVEAQTLKPLMGSRTIFTIAKDKTTTFSSAYEGGAVKLTADQNGKVTTTHRELPTPTKDSPDPGYYDDESLFWVLRGIPLEKGFEGAYKDLNASNGQIFTASVTVEKTERVEVPAGTFTAWKVRLETNSITQFFWIDEAAPHAVIQANIETIRYQLTSTK